MAKVAIRHITADPAQSGVIVYAGDSLSKDFSGQPKWPEMVAAALVVPGVVHHNVASGGMALIQILEQATTLVDSLLAEGQTVRVHVAWAGTNDLAGQLSTGAELHTLTASYCAARRLAGWEKLLVGTIMPRSNDGLWPGFEAQRQVFNAAIRLDHSFADALIDFAADTRMGDPGDELDLTYYTSDRVHPNDTGQAVLASIATPIITALV